MLDHSSATAYGNIREVVVCAGLQCSMTKGPWAGAYSVVSAGRWTVALQSVRHGIYRLRLSPQRSALGDQLTCGDAGYPGNLDGTGATREISRATSTGRYPKILTYQIQTTCLHSALGFRSFISYLIILSCKNRIACRWRTLGAVLLLLLRRHVTPQLIHVIYEFLPEWRC